MRALPRTLLLAAAALCLTAAAPAAQAAAPAPAWSLFLGAAPSNLTPGGQVQYFVHANDVGAGPTTEGAQIEATLPEELTVVSATPVKGGSCTIAPHSLSCQAPDPIASGHDLLIKFLATVAPTAAGSLAVQATVSGGGALPLSRTATAPVQSDPVAFGFPSPGFSAPLSGAEGSPTTLAGSHPFQQTVSFGFSEEETHLGAAALLSNAGHPKTIEIALPAGLLGNPAASPLLCTEAQLQLASCPEASQLGIFELGTTLGGATNPAVLPAPLYNMVPPPGSPAELASSIGGFGYTLHLLASVRSEGDYGINATTPDAIAPSFQPFLTVQAQVWDNPSATAHDAARGNCIHAGTAGCPKSADPQPFAFWTTPTRCSGAPEPTTLAAESWEAPGAFQEAGYESADLAGNPVSLGGCNALGFEPTISAQPTTNLTDSPSGLDVDLHQPQDSRLGAEEAGRSPAQLKDATVTLPAGMVVNPSQADGLQACSAAEIGLTSALGATPAHFDKTPASCPAAAKLGTVQVTTPLLAQRTEEGTRLATDPETGEPIPRALEGSVYLAAPFANPFGSLLAIYLTVEDAQSGTYAKLAGEIEADPTSGRLTTRFAENPQLPIEDVRLHLFGGPRASLITPPTCGTHTTTTDLVPWSTPEGATAHPQSSFQATATPAGGPCPTSEAALPSAPAFNAGTIGRQAGAYSPFVLRLSREDGSQRLTGIDTTLPPGLSGKLAGIPYCPEAQIAQAQARSHPNEGRLERESPSCPAASQVGTVTVAAGAGPTPYHTTGAAYLAGPYKSAPLSLAIVTPAIAGPFDLGVVVVRTALHVDPTSAQIHAVSDPFPTILDGIPLDLRTVALEMGRPEFTLNPTSCDPLAISGSATSALGQIAPLNQPFQVGGCSALKFKPKLALRLKGATARGKNPALRATLTMPPGGANIARAAVALPHSEFLDQAHIRTVCTRVQFNAAPGNGAACPKGSVYGHARAFSPLLDSPLEGPVYLRSSSNPLPDLVAALGGQIQVALIGRVDSVKGGIRNSFEVVPDQPVSKFVLTMQGGKKGLLENSTNICRSKNRASARFTGQNGKTADLKPLLRPKCPKHKKGHKGHKKHRRAGR